MPGQVMLDEDWQTNHYTKPAGHGPNKYAILTCKNTNILNIKSVIYPKLFIGVC